MRGNLIFLQLKLSCDLHPKLIFVHGVRPNDMIQKWWLVPIFVMMVVVGTLLVFAQGSALAPFIYSLF